MEKEVVLGLNLIVIAPLLVSLIGFQPKETPESYVARVDAYYQEVFRDLSLVDQGLVGTTRIERSSLSKHRGGDFKVPQRKDREMWFEVYIYGNRGKPLNFASIESRYERHYPFTADFELEHMKAAKTPGKSVVDYRVRKEDPTLKEAIKRFQNSKVNSVVVKRGVVRWELRPVRLSKKECLSCHKSMKLGDPVAVMTYGTAPSKSDKPFPR